MTPAILFGSGLGMGLWALAVWLAPPRPALGAVLHRATSPAPDPILTAPAGNPGNQLGRTVTAPLSGLLRAVGLPTASVRRDLTVLERPVDSYLVEKVTLTLAGLLVPSSAFAAFAVFGGVVGVQAPLAAVVGCAVAGFVAPDLRVRGRAARRRAD